ncbi:hypothetical protein BO71DRAFT_441774 [Aspergillus ellipticus CBS 707.79]|uniref:Fungal-type protein kinase domain-containing protein n=1 Tax=Aspergillus ellipticus CBS 707.79 TaxID=1448320 RepID=A0A319DGI0_9EURO|nr:hypothetical protein BO71DRAFT_441774 [Aspergillus ellipticus CBS 707.79]
MSEQAKDKKPDSEVAVKTEAIEKNTIPAEVEALVMFTPESLLARSTHERNIIDYTVPYNHLTSNYNKEIRREVTECMEAVRSLSGPKASKNPDPDNDTVRDTSSYTWVDILKPDQSGRSRVRRLLYYLAAMKPLTENFKIGVGGWKFNLAKFECHDTLDCDGVLYPRNRRTNSRRWPVAFFKDVTGQEESYIREKEFSMLLLPMLIAHRFDPQRRFYNSFAVLCNDTKYTIVRARATQTYLTEMGKGLSIVPKFKIYRCKPLDLTQYERRLAFLKTIWTLCIMAEEEYWGTQVGPRLTWIQRREARESQRT